MVCQPNTLLSLQLPYFFQFINFRLASYDDISSFKKYKVEFPEQLRGAVNKRKAEYLAGRVCSMQVLRCLGITGAQIKIGPGREPLWPEKVCGSISHCAEMAVAVVSADPLLVGLGIDLEQVMPIQQELNIRHQIIFPNEYTIFASLSNEQPHPLTLVFSAKESIFKALYPSAKAFFGFEAAELIDFNQYSLLFRLTESLSKSLPAGTILIVYFQQNMTMVLTECALLAS